MVGPEVDLQDLPSTDLLQEAEQRCVVGLPARLGEVGGHDGRLAEITVPTQGLTQQRRRPVRCRPVLLTYVVQDQQVALVLDLAQASARDG